MNDQPHLGSDPDAPVDPAGMRCAACRTHTIRYTDRIDSNNERHQDWRCVTCGRTHMQMTTAALARGFDGATAAIISILNMAAASPVSSDPETARALVEARYGAHVAEHLFAAVDDMGTGYPLMTLAEAYRHGNVRPTLAFIAHQYGQEVADHLDAAAQGVFEATMREVAMEAPPAPRESAAVAARRARLAPRTPNPSGLLRTLVARILGGKRL